MTFYQAQLKPHFLNESNYHCVIQPQDMIKNKFKKSFGATIQLRCIIPTQQHRPETYMATKLKNIPTQAQLKMHYAYLDERFTPYNGRLIPIDIYNTQCKELIMLYMEHIDPGIINVDSTGKHPVRVFNMQGNRYQEPKLVWLYHKGQYPQTAIMHKDSNRLNCNIKNLSLTNAASVHIASTSSGVPGIVQIKSPDSYNAWMWSATYSKNKYEERPVDKDGHICYKDGWKTRGWHKRKTKIVNTRSRKLVGYYMTKEKAIRALRLYTNEVEYPICRYRTDMKLKQVFLTLNGMFPNNPEGAVWHYIQVLYNRKAIDADEAADLAEAMGHGHKVLPLRDEE